MPRENRKRGKKHKKRVDENNEAQPLDVPEDQPEAGPSWIVSAPAATSINQEAPFGYVDPEIKAYFRTVDLQIREWQEEATNPGDGSDDADLNEDRRLFFVAALTEMSGKEKQLATDPDCSNILERMAYSMDDFARRVFVDRLSGSYEQLVKHRFASHVCQTLFTVAQDTIAREAHGIFPPTTTSSEEGELHTLTQLTLDVCEELLHVLPSLVMDPFASHVVRALLSLLMPDLFPQDLSTRKPAVVRSKRSAAHRAKQGTMKSVFTSEDRQAQSDASKTTPKGFQEAAINFVTTLRGSLDENEIRALAASQVASPVLQMLLEIEAEQGMHDEPGSLMDRVLAGLITTLHDDPSATIEASDYVGTLLRDPTSSHLLETLVSRTPENVFNVVWATYFKGKLARLTVHPVANFVVARAFDRLSPTQLAEVCQELSNVAIKILKSSRTGVFRALVDRAAALHKQEDIVMDTILNVFELFSVEDRKLLAPCVLRLLPLHDYKEALSSVETKLSEQRTAEDQRPRQKARVAASSDPMEPKTQGAVLLQSILRLADPHNQLVLDSIQSLSMDELLAMAYHVTSSRVLDAILDSSTVPAKAKRKFILTFIGHFHILVDDRIGSRVGDRCWAYADPYLKEKIARSLVPYEQNLAASFYGKFFARNLNLHLFQRNLEEWKTLQANAKAAAQQRKSAVPSKQHSQPTQAPYVPTEQSQSTVEVAHVTDKEGKKRKARHDEIDDLFNATLGKKVKRAGLATDGKPPKPLAPAEKGKHQDDSSAELKDKGLKDVLGAIKAAPKDEKDHRKRKKAK